MVQWNTPKTLYAGEVAGYEYLNTYHKGNLEFLKSRPFNNATTGAVSTTSTSYVLMSNTTVTLDTFGGNVLCWLCGWHNNGGLGSFTTFDFVVDGVFQGDAGVGTAIITTSTAGYNDVLNLIMITTTRIDAGTHTCQIYWKTSVSGTANANLRLYIMEIR